MKPALLATLLMTFALSGCLTDPDADLIEDAPSPLLSAVSSIIKNSINEKETLKRCKQERSSDPRFKDEDRIHCNTKIRRDEFAAQNQERKENRERQEALEQAFNNRDQATDTADIIKAQQQRNDWINEGEKQLRPIIIVDKSDELE